MHIQTACKKLVDDFRARPTLRAGSLITTVFGDAIAPRGGTVWLGSLIRAMADFGISERLVRTSVFRLAKDGWLQSEQIGRRSYYSLTASGREQFDQATRRIYGEPVGHWDGEWCLLLLSGPAFGNQDALNDRLHEAVQYHDTAAATKLLVDGADPNSVNIIGHTPLIRAIKMQQVKCLFRTGL